MNFFAVQSLNSYTKNMEMQMKWQKKKASGDFTADGTTTIDDWVKKQADDIRESQKDGSNKLSAQIRLKMNSGQKLNAEELEYLRNNDPQTWQKYKSMEAEQKSYEQELRRCKTKEEVQRVKMTHVAAALGTVNDVKNNPNIPKSEKLALIWQEHQKMKALEKIETEFVESGEYAKLPTEAEARKAEKDLKEAKEEEQGIKDPSKENTEEVSADPEEEEKDTETESRISEAEAQKAREDVRQAALEKRKMTPAEAELTPEARKVKRARARAAYESGQSGTVPGAAVDVTVK